MATAEINRTETNYLVVGMTSNSMFSNQTYTTLDEAIYACVLIEKRNSNWYLYECVGIASSEKNPNY